MNLDGGATFESSSGGARPISSAPVGDAASPSGGAGKKRVQITSDVDPRDGSGEARMYDVGYRAEAADLTHLKLAAKTVSSRFDLCSCVYVCLRVCPSVSVSLHVGLSVTIFPQASD